MTALVTGSAYSDASNIWVCITVQLAGHDGGDLFEVSCDDKAFLDN